MQFYARSAPTLKEADGELVRVEITDVLGHVGVEEPRGQPLQHLCDLLSQNPRRCSNNLEETIGRG